MIQNNSFQSKPNLNLNFNSNSNPNSKSYPNPKLYFMEFIFDKLDLSDENTQHKSDKLFKFLTDLEESPNSFCNTEKIIQLINSIYKNYIIAVFHVEFPTNKIVPCGFLSSIFIQKKCYVKDIFIVQNIGNDGNNDANSDGNGHQQYLQKFKETLIYFDKSMKKRNMRILFEKNLPCINEINAIFKTYLKNDKYYVKIDKVIGIINHDTFRVNPYFLIDKQILSDETINYTVFDVTDQTIDNPIKMENPSVFRWEPKYSFYEKLVANDDHLITINHIYYCLVTNRYVYNDKYRECDLDEINEIDVLEFNY